MLNTEVPGHIRRLLELRPLVKERCTFGDIRVFRIEYAEIEVHQEVVGRRDRQLELEAIRVCRTDVGRCQRWQLNAGVRVANDAGVLDIGPVRIEVGCVQTQQTVGQIGTNTDFGVLDDFGVIRKPELLVRCDAVDAAGIEAFGVADVAHDVGSKLLLQRQLDGLLVERNRRRIRIDDPSAGKRVTTRMQNIG